YSGGIAHRSEGPTASAAGPPMDINRGPFMTTPPGTRAAPAALLSDPHPASHPDRLAVIATLLGIRPQSVERCRVLELGCGSGGNLLPMAEGLPQSTFVGIDASDDALDIARQTAADLAMGNVEFRQSDLLGGLTDLGRFDYVLCHGHYSRVSPEVQDRI